MEEHIKSFILGIWDNTTQLFPGPQPISIERIHLPILKQKLYVVCEKTDGVRHFLVCVQYGQKKVTALVNRMFGIRIVKIGIPLNTLLDGELLGDTFHIYDAMMVDGQSTMTEPLTTRLEKARGVLGGPCIGMKLVVKRMYPLSDFHTLVKQTQGDPHVDGFIFTPVKEPVKTGTHESLFKWKPMEKITIDFLCKDNALHIWDKKMGFLKIQNFTATEQEDGKILECKRECGSWVFVKIRTDKDHPNNRRTYLRTLVNIREHIQEHELV